MTINVKQHNEGWVATIEAGDSIQLYFNGNPLPETSITVPVGGTAQVRLQYNIETPSP